MSNTVGSVAAQDFNRLGNGAEENSAPFQEPSAVSDAQLRAAARVLDAYVSRLQARNQSSGALRPTVSAAAHRAASQG